MATITQTVNLPEPRISIIPRDDLKTELQKYWINRPNSRMGIGKLQLKEGLVYTIPFFRRDLAMVQYKGICNVFIEPDGRIQIDMWPGAKITEDERAQIMTFCKQIPITYADFWARQIKFLSWFREHGHELNGRTPEEAVNHLEAAGF